MNKKYITVHCSATNPERKFTVEMLHNAHVNINGWSSIGYHFYITTDGFVNSCRNINKTGAHVKGHNKDNIGICLEGGVNRKGKPENNYTDKQWDALRYLISELCGKYGIEEVNIKGHRDWFGDSNGDGVIDRRDWFKDCPCFDVQAKLKEWGDD